MHLPLNRFLTVFLSILFFTLSPAFAVEHPLPDETDELRAQALFHQIRCAVCSGQSIADSPADVASDMRRSVRQRVNIGESNVEVKNFMKQQYGNAIMISTPFTQTTAFLWFGPISLLMLGAGLAIAYFRSTRQKKA